MDNKFLLYGAGSLVRPLGLKVSKANMMSLVFLLPAYFIICIFLVKSVGGIDLVEYEKNSALGFKDWSWYYYKEFFSWFLIKFSYEVSWWLGLKQPVLVINAVLFLMYLFFTRNMGLQAKIVPLILIGPMSVLLSFNILRQYISVVLLCLALLNLLYGKGKVSTLLSCLAFFSHQSIVLLVPLVFVCRFFSFYVASGVVFCGQLIVMLLSAVLGLGLYSDQGYNYVGDISSAYKVVSHFIYVFFLFVMLQVGRLWRDYSLMKYDFIGKIVSVLMVFSISMLVFPWPDWIVNRLLINISFIYMFLLLSRERFVAKRGGGFVFFLCVVNAVGLLFHGGAISMLSFNMPSS